MPAQQNGAHASAAAGGSASASSSKSPSGSASPTRQRAETGASSPAAGKGKARASQADIAKSPKAAGKQRAATADEADAGPPAKRLARAGSHSPRGGSPRLGSPIQTRTDGRRRSLDAVASAAGAAGSGSPMEGSRKEATPRGAMAALTESPPSPSPLFFTRGDQSGSPSARAGSSPGSSASDSLDLTSIAARKEGSPRVNMTVATTAGLPNHAASPMSPIPNRPIASGGAFPGMDLGISGIDPSMVSAGTDSIVPGSTEIPQALTLTPLPNLANYAQGAAEDSASSGDGSFERRPASTGDISGGAGSSSADISLSDMTAPDHEHLSPAATISRGLYHQCGTARRVKVYELQNDVWFDHGTGYCAGVYDEERDQALLVAKSEELCQYMNLPPAPSDDKARGPNAAQTGGAPGQAGTEEEDAINQYIIVVSAHIAPEEVLLCTQVVREDIYQRQQDTLIVWTEPGGKDMALSFQEAEGCNEIWEFLSEVQKHFKSSATDDGSSEPGHPMSRELGFEESFQTGDLLSIENGGQLLPEPTLGNVEQIDMAVRDLAGRPQQVRERFTEWVLRTSYIKQMIELFKVAEDLEQLNVLHILCSIMQNLLLINDTVLFEWILQDDVFLGVVGMLEYDPAFPRDKASFRDYLSDPARFRQVVPINDANILAKIHHTYRLQYLKDVILARILEDATFSTMQSILFFYQVDIVTYCGGNEDFLRRLFGVFKDKAEPPFEEAEQRKRDGVIFLQQLCNMGKTIQLHSRITLYHTLVEWGLIDVIEFAFTAGNVTLRNAAAEMLMLIIEYDANSVQLRILELKERRERTLMAILIGHLQQDGDLGLKSQIVEILRVLLDCGDGSNTTASQAMMQQQVLGHKQGPKADPERFLTAFYEDDCDLLFAPLKQLPDVTSLPRKSRLPPMSLSRSALFGHLCDLLCFISSCHGFRSQYYVITSEISKKVASLLRCRDKHVRCASLRFFRACLANNNQFINRHHIKIDLFETLLDITEEEADRDNLVTSACISYFEYMKQEAVMKPLINHIAERNTDTLRRLALQPNAGKVFGELLLRWEQSRTPAVEIKPPVRAGDSKPADSAARKRLGQKGMQSEEESYFLADDPPASSESSTGSGVSLPNLVPYGDDEFDFELLSTPSKSGALALNTSSSSSSDPLSSPQAQGSPTAAHAAAAASAGTAIDDAPMLRAGEKRRRDAEEEDALDKLSAKRKSPPSSAEPPQTKRLNQGGAASAAAPVAPLDDDAGGFVREDAVEDADAASAPSAAPAPAAAAPRPAASGAKKVSLFLSQTGLQIAQQGASTGGSSNNNGNGNGSGSNGENEKDSSAGADAPAPAASNGAPPAQPDAAASTEATTSANGAAPASGSK